MEQLFLELPEYMKDDAKKWGMNDTYKKNYTKK